MQTRGLALQLLLWPHETTFRAGSATATSLTQLIPQNQYAQIMSLSLILRRFSVNFHYNLVSV